MAQKHELPVAWWSNEYYDVKVVTLLIPDDKEEAIVKAQQLCEENPDIYTIKIRIDENCMATGTDYRLGHGFVQVSGGKGTALYFIGQDSFDSHNQVESDEFWLSEVPDPEPRCKCTQCGGTNVQSKAWVSPNENDKFVDYISEEIEDCFCDDCDEHVNLDN